MNNCARRVRSQCARPHLLVRLLLIGAGVLCTALPYNPVVRLQAVLGLSPAPWERFTGMKTIFSGMTEGFHRLAQGDLGGSFAANILAPPFAVSLVVCILFWRWPVIRTKKHEAVFFCVMIAGSVAVALANGRA